MDGFKRKLSLLCILFLFGCASDPSVDKSSSEDFSQLDAPPSDGDATADAGSPAKKDDAFSDFDNDKSAAAKNEDERLDQEVSQADLPAPDAPPVTETPAPGVSTPDVVDNSGPQQPDQAVIEPTPAPPVAEQPQPAPPSPTGRAVIIRNMGIRSQADGPVLEIQASGPIEFSQNSNTNLNQLMIDIPNSKLGPKARLPLNMRDFSGPIASVTAYALNGQTSRIVVQLRPGSSEPTVEQSGNNILVKSSGSGEAQPVAQAPVVPVQDGSSIMNSDSLEDFLANNQKFFGKEISIETTDETELRDVFKLISDEAHVNLVVTDDVKGKISVKLKNTPWDQALVIIMKSKKLGYSRSGNILRIAPVSDLKKEEEDSLSLMAAKKTNGPLIAKSLQINYAKVDDLEKQIKNVLSPRGSVVSDSRTSALIVTDVGENLSRAIQLVRVLDIPPQQVLIEGKVVEAQENFERDIGFNWGLSGRTTQLQGATTSSGPIRLSQVVNVNPGLPDKNSFGLNFTLGTFDIIGDLSAALALYEAKGSAKVLSAPRIVALHNEKSSIDQTLQVPIITSSTAAAGATAVPTVTFKDISLRLEVTPLVTNEGTVILDVSVLRQFAGPVVDQTTKAVPINSRAAKTKVLVRNGQTAVIGGIYENNMTDSENRVPGLASLPVLGWLFKNKTKISNHNELLIFLTPKIMASAQATPGVLKSQESMDNSQF